MALLFNLLPTKIVIFVQIDEGFQKNERNSCYLAFFFVYLQQKKKKMNIGDCCGMFGGMGDCPTVLC